MSRIFAVSGLVVMLLLLWAGSAFAANIRIMVDGKYLNASAQQVNGRMMVPMRSIFEALNANVSWYNGAVVATLDGVEIKLRPHESYATVNGHKVIMPVPSQEINGSTMVPLRFVGETLNSDVDWLNDLQTVLITSDKFKNITNKPRLEKEHYGKYEKFRNSAISYETNKERVTALQQKYVEFNKTIDPVVNTLTPLVNQNDPLVKVKATQFADKISQLEKIKLELQTIGNSSVFLGSIGKQVGTVYDAFNNIMQRFAKDGLTSGTKSSWEYLLKERGTLTEMISSTSIKLAEEKQNVLSYYEENVKQ